MREVNMNAKLTRQSNLKVGEIEENTRETKKNYQIFNIVNKKIINESTKVTRTTFGISG